MLLQNLEKYEIILASKSPRRKQLLSELGIKFRVKSMDIPEDIPEGMGMTEIPIYLAELRANSFIPHLKENHLVFTADPIVWLNGQVLNKPPDYADGFRMRRALSGEKHQVQIGRAHV